MKLEIITEEFPDGTGDRFKRILLTYKQGEKRKAVESMIIDTENEHGALLVADALREMAKMIERQV